MTESVCQSICLAVRWQSAPLRPYSYSHCEMKCLSLIVKMCFDNISSKKKDHSISSFLVYVNDVYFVG